MSVTLYSHGSVFLLHWGDAEMADIDATLKGMRAMKRGPNALFWISLIPEDAAAPSADMARECARRIHEIAPLCASMHQVFEGNGFFIGFKRSVLTGILTAASKFGAPKLHALFRVHGSLEEVYACAPASHRADLRTVLDRLALSRAQKMKTAPPMAPRPSQAL